MSSPSTPAVSVSSLRKQLSSVDPSNLAQLQLLYRALQVTVEPHPRPRPAALKRIATTTLSEADTFAYLSFSNTKREGFGFTHFDVPLFTLRNTSAKNILPSPWLHESLTKCSRVWNNRNEAGRRLMLELVIVEALDNLTRVEPDASTTTDLGLEDHPSSSPPASSSADHHPLPLLVFPEVPISHLCTLPDGTPAVITGRCDVGIGYIAPNTTQPESATPLSIVEAKSLTSFESGWPQLLAYLGMAHHARKRASKDNCTVYGIYSDGQKYRFVEVDNDSMVHRSKVYNIIWELAEICAFVYSILHTIRRSSLTTSQVKDRAVRLADVQGFENTVRAEEFMFEMVCVPDGQVIDL